MTDFALNERKQCDSAEEYLLPQQAARRRVWGGDRCRANEDIRE
ncbi:hypothetical protein [Paraburkholderia sp. J11-2]|nr:hypothetical protein [Paraburkholderia sp. J11-2]